MIYFSVIIIKQQIVDFWYLAWMHVKPQTIHFVSVWSGAHADGSMRVVPLWTQRNCTWNLGESDSCTVSQNALGL